MAKRVRWPEGRPGEAAKGAGDREQSSPAGGVGSDAGQADPGGGRKGKLLSPSRRRACVDHVMTELCIWFETAQMDDVVFDRIFFAGCVRLRWP